MLFLGLNDCLFLSLYRHALKQLEVCIPGPQLSVETLRNFLQIAHDANSFLFFPAVVVDSGEFDVVVRDGDVA